MAARWLRHVARLRPRSNASVRVFPPLRANSIILFMGGEPGNPHALRISFEDTALTIRQWIGRAIDPCGDHRVERVLAATKPGSASARVTFRQNVRKAT